MSKRKRFPAEQIIPVLREAEVELARGVTVASVCRKLNITEATYYRWRKEYGRLRIDPAKRLQVLEFSRHFLGESSGDDLSYPVPIISINNDWLERLFSLTGPCAKANVAIEIVCFFLVGRKAHLRPTR